jgi:hypothetical protein
MRSILEWETISKNAFSEFTCAPARGLVSRFSSPSASFCTYRGVNHTAALTSPRTSTSAFIPRIKRFILVTLDEAVHEDQPHVVNNFYLIGSIKYHLDENIG